MSYGLWVAAWLSFCIFPPKFGNIWFGICTFWTMKNTGLWKYGQKLFAVSLFIIGLIFSILGGLKIDNAISPFTMFALLIVLWTISKFIVHKILARKFSS
ncbi:MAG: SdpI family protein [Chitinophagaceae bacterium]|nr:SdpI family protein [Chitinophagaceae bacterium]